MKTTTTCESMVLPDFTQVSLLVMGDVMLDRYLQGDAHRVSPEAPVPIVNVQSTQERPGGAANVAINLASLGAQVDLLGMTGQDAAAKTMRELLQQQQVQVHFCQHAAAKTITKLRILGRQQQLLRVDFESDIGWQQTELLTSAMQRYQQLLPACQLVVLSDYHKGTLADCPRLIQLAKQQGKMVLVDPKSNDFSRYRGATLLTPNRAEFEAAMGSCQDQQTLLLKAQQALSDYQLTAILITLGEAGMVLVTAESEPLIIPTKAQEVYDVTGAGDTVIAVMAAMLACGEAPVRAARLANLAAGIVVSKLGAASISSNDLQAATKQAGNITGLMSIASLQARLTRVRQRQQKIVFTNGCFDILHAGHVSYLNEAKRHGDFLIVGLNSDESVARLKGDTRPIHNLEQRAQVIAALAMVDAVVAFSEDTPEQLIKQLNPDLLVKGGDYQREQIAGSDFVLAQGGEVKIIDYLPGLSTTRIINRLQTA